MVKRFVKSSTVDSLGKIHPKVVDIVSTKSNVQLEAKTQSYFKRNYLDVLKKIIPGFYFQDDQLVSGTKVPPQNQLINSHIKVNQQMNQILPISALTDDRNLSSIESPSAFARFFYKQNFPATINPDDFDRNILKPQGKTYASYGTSTLFLNYVSGTLLPSFPAVTLSGPPGLDLATMTASAYSNDSSGTHRYLINNLGWLYFLNTSSTTWDGFSTSDAVATLIAENLWKNHPISLSQSLNVFQEYLWRHESALLASGISGSIPTDYASSISTSTTYTSGNQLLDRLKILNDIIYSPLYLDAPDNKVKTAFQNYIQSSALLTEEEENGPLTNFLRGISFGIADRVSEANELNSFYDIATCPDQFLELLAELIGWKLIGADIDKWRVQIRNAVQIYKQKGTKKSIQLILDSLFSTGVLNGTGSDVLFELWESYIPDLMYYALATSSAAVKNYSPEQAAKFGVKFSPSGMDHNIRSLVDKILFDLVRDFPERFRIGKTKFPTPIFVVQGTEREWRGPYHFHNPASEGWTADGKGGWIGANKQPSSIYMTGPEHSDQSVNLAVEFDPTFTFKYRDAIHYIPPFEKRKYYTPTLVNSSMLEKIEYYLVCYGVDKKFARILVDYIRLHTVRTLERSDSINGFLFYTKQQKYPLNFSSIVQEVTTERTPDPVDLLNLWNGKSSHFLLQFNASSFNWDSYLLSATTAYGVKQVARAVDEVAPAHAIPEILLTVCSVDDSASGIVDNACIEIQPNFHDLYEGSGSVTTNFAVSALDMAYVATVTTGMSPNRFTRNDVKYPYNNLLSGVGAAADQFLTSTRRNTLRRRNYKNLFPESGCFTRLGNSSPGRLEVSSSLYAFVTSSTGYYSLGFMPSALKYAPVPVYSDTFGDLLNISALDGVWSICQNLLSTDSFYGYNTSNTFASRAKQNVNSSDCNSYGRRGQLAPIIGLINNLHDEKKYLEASSIVSGYYLSDGAINKTWASSSPKITPNDLSAWVSAFGENTNFTQSVGNQLINNDIANRSLDYYENFAFGKNINTLFGKYITSSLYAAHAIRNNYNQIGGPNIFSHTYGPLIYNSDYEMNGSAIDTSSYLQSSSIFEGVDISFYGGSGILSLSGTSSTPTYFVGTYAASDSSSVYIGTTEFRNEHLVSAIDLVDTSSIPTFTSHPIFSIYKLASTAVSKFNINSYLLNNTIIKYHRSTQTHTLPRLRIKIDNSDTTDKARNFLQPNHDYNIDIDLHNIDLSSAYTGGQTLGVMIRTEPEEDKVWIYKPTLSNCNEVIDQWEQHPVTSLTSSSTGIRFAESYSQGVTIPEGKINVLQGSGTGRGINVVGIPEVRGITCWDTLYETEYTLPALANVSTKTRERIQFKLSTHNNKGSIPPPTYTDKFGVVHRTNQKYVIEIFTLDPVASKFIVFDNISITDITNKALASIATSYGNIEIKEEQLKTIFRFYRSMQKGNASRNKDETAAVMDTNGGARSNYRSIVSMYSNSRDTNSGSLKEIHIDEG